MREARIGGREAGVLLTGLDGLSLGSLAFTLVESERFKQGISPDFDSVETWTTCGRIAEDNQFTHTLRGQHCFRTATGRMIGEPVVADPGLPDYLAELVSRPLLDYSDDFGSRTAKPLPLSWLTERPSGAVMNLSLTGTVQLLKRRDQFGINPSLPLVPVLVLSTGNEHESFSWINDELREIYIKSTIESINYLLGARGLKIIDRYQGEPTGSSTHDICRLTPLQETAGRVADALLRDYEPGGVYSPEDNKALASRLIASLRAAVPAQSHRTGVVVDMEAARQRLAAKGGRSDPGHLNLV